MNREHIVLKDDDTEVSATLVPSLMIYAVNIIGNDLQKVVGLLTEMTTQLETRQFNKFWLHGTDSWFNSVMPLIATSPELSRYNWYDEDIVPAGQLSSTAAYNLNYTINFENSTLFRVFVLKQSERIIKFKSKFGDIYAGTLPTDIQSKYGKQKEV